MSKKPKNLFRLPPPTILSIETSIFCNGHCVMCPREGVLKQRRRSMMDEEMVYRILDEAQEWRPTIQWGWINEPLGDMRIMDFAKYAQEREMPGWINSNGSLISPTVTDHLLKSGLSYINFAVDSLDLIKFKHTRPGLDPHQVISKIKYFIQRNKEEGHPMNVWVSQIVIPGVNDGEFPKFEEFWMQEGADKVQHPCYRRRGASHDSTFVVNVPNSYYCYFAENEMNITVDGDVPLCACDAQCLNVQASIKDGVFDAWNTYGRQRLVSFIRKHGQNKVPFCREHN